MVRLFKFASRLARYQCSSTLTSQQKCYFQIGKRNFFQCDEANPLPAISWYLAVIREHTKQFVLTRYISQILFVSALALQCYSGQLIEPAIPGVDSDTVKLKACPAEATRCANTETVAEIPIPNQSPLKTTQKLSQCANEAICGSTLNCDMVKKNVPGFQSCKVSVVV